jgi:hypothetical protein
MLGKHILPGAVDELTCTRGRRIGVLGVRIAAALGGNDGVSSFHVLPSSGPDYFRRGGVEHTLAMDAESVLGWHYWRRVGVLTDC